MARLALAAALLVGCVNQSLLPASTTPEPAQPTAGGTLACNQIMEECDRFCAEPTCVDACGQKGTPDAQRLHGALVACAKASGCLEQTCVMERCDAEIQACQADTTGAAATASSAPDSAGTVEEQPASPALPSGPPPPGLPGLWKNGSVSATGWEGPGGAWKPGHGSGAALRLEPDGRFEKAAMLETTVGSCTTSAFSWTTGRWSADDATVVLREEKSRFRFADGCNPAKNYENSPELATDSRRYELAQDPATRQPVLKLYTKDGNADTYTR